MQGAKQVAVPARGLMIAVYFSLLMHYGYNGGTGQTMSNERSNHYGNL
jgi:hypothetical protein